MTGQRVTRELLATLRPGDVVELTSTAGPALTVRGALTHARMLSGRVLPEQLVVGDEQSGLVLSTDSGNPAGWAFGMDLTVVSRVPRLYENSTRPVPVAGDIVRDCEGDAWQCCEDGTWSSHTRSRTRRGDTTETVQMYEPLTLLWDGATGSLPGAPS